MAADATAHEAAKLLRESLDAEANALSFARTTSLNAACAHLHSTGGQHIRGRLGIAASRLGPQPDSHLIQHAMCAIELLHLASLAHDDIIDAGTERRGVPTAGIRFGQRTAGFAGGWIFARAVEIVSECGAESLALFASTAREMCDGGMRELRDLYDPSRTAAEYFEAASQKTSSAFSLAARLGAECALADSSAIAHAAAFGHEFGLAYQIWDDLIDLLASPAQSGKSPSSDLRQGVYTLPVIFAAEECDEIKERFLGVRLDDKEQAAAIEMIAGTRGIERAANIADHHAENAVAAISELSDATALSELLAEVRGEHLKFLQ